MRVPEVEVRKKGKENSFKEVMPANFPNPGRDMSIHIQEAERSSDTIQDIFSETHCSQVLRNQKLRIVKGTK